MPQDAVPDAPDTAPPELSLATAAMPDSRLIALVRLLARRAARRHVQEMIRERGSS
jgi:hypothetical protein